MMCGASLRLSSSVSALDYYEVGWVLRGLVCVMLLRMVLLKVIKRERDSVVPSVEFRIESVMGIDYV